MTTIDHATSEDVTEEVKETVNMDLPKIIGDDEVTIRSQMQKVVDGIVSLSSYARMVDAMRRELDALKATIEEANARVLEANATRDQAIAEATEAKASAKMAREAYNVVDATCNSLASKLQMYTIEIDELKQSESILQATVAKLEEQNRTTTQLLDIAREERDGFREEAGRYRNNWEDEQLKNMEFEDVKEKLATTEEALGICAKNVAEARSTAQERLNTVNDLSLERSGLYSKINGLEDDNKRQGELIMALQTKINNASMHLH